MRQNRKKNELVLTSGHGELLPAGLPVGRVVAGRGRSFYIEPAVDLRAISFVSVLIRPEGSKSDKISVLEEFFTPLPQKDESRLLEGFSTKDVLQ